MTGPYAAHELQQAFVRSKGVGSEFTCTALALAFAVASLALDVAGAFENSYFLEILGMCFALASAILDGVALAGAKYWGWEGVDNVDLVTVLLDTVGAGTAISLIVP